MVEQYALVESFRDTQRRIREDAALAGAALRAQAGTRLYLPDFSAIAPVEKSASRAVRVVEDTSFHCAAGLLGEGRVAVLNFANAFSPGGGVLRGAMAQEECLCRSSTLYSALTIPYLLKNYYKNNARAAGDMGTDAVIYTPGVTVFKSDDELPAALEAPFEVDVLTCAAPYLNPQRKKPVPEDKLRAILERRVLNILEVAAANGADALVLGAFGCGAFNNPPELVAGAFRSALVDREYRRFFRRVVFAIKGRSIENNNYRVFARVLGDGEEYA